MAARISALIVSIAIVVAVLGFMVWRIGAVMGWEQAKHSWLIIAVLAAVVLLIGWFVYLAVRSKIRG